MLNPTLSLQKLQSWALELGFQQVGISDIDISAHAQHLQNWLSKKHHGSMAWMEKHAALRADPHRLLPDATEAKNLRVISVRMDYLPDDNAPNDKLPAKKNNLIAKVSADGTAYIARYTLGRDYHKVLRKRLAALALRIEQHAQEPASDSGQHFRALVDSAPLLERAFAEKAGLGWIGKNTMLINSRAGSYFFLGEILTDLPLPVSTAPPDAHCGSCTACLDLCPTKAFVAPYQLDARRCISYLTIENKGAIPLELRPLIGNRIFGCDDCQAVCPWNKFAHASMEEDFQPRHGLDHIALIELFGWNEEEYLHKTAGSALRRIGYAGWLRNIAVALGNAHRRADITDALLARRDDPSGLVREHVAWALGRHSAATFLPIGGTKN